MNKLRFLFVIHGIFVFLIIYFVRPREAKKPVVTESTNKSQRSKGRHYDPHFGYEPYWPGGEWVLYGDPDAPTTARAPLVCGDECHYLYRKIGEVCGRDTDNVRYRGCNPNRDWCYGDPPDDLSGGYRTFKSYCEFLDFECKSHRTKQRSKWIFVHVGPCVGSQDAYFKPMSTDAQPVGRMLQYVAALNSRFHNYKRDPC